MSEKVLVTGGSGFIGRRVCRLLVERDIPIVILDSNPAPGVVDQLRQVMPGMQAAHLTVVEADITDLEQVESDFLHSDGITHVIHLASLLTAGVEEYLVLGTDVNVMGTVHILDVCAAAGCRELSWPAVKPLTAMARPAMDRVPFAKMTSALLSTTTMPMAP